MKKNLVNIKLSVATVIAGSVRLPGSIVEVAEVEAKNLMNRGRAVLHGDGSDMNAADPGKLAGVTAELVGAEITGAVVISAGETSHLQGASVKTDPAPSDDTGNASSNGDASGDGDGEDAGKPADSDGDAGEDGQKPEAAPAPAESTAPSPEAAPKESDPAGKPKSGGGTGNNRRNQRSNQAKK